jgi:hypothetical protein
MHRLKAIKIQKSYSYTLSKACFKHKLLNLPFTISKTDVLIDSFGINVRHFHPKNRLFFLRIQSMFEPDNRAQTLIKQEIKGL